MPLDKEATRSEINLVAVMKMTKVLVDEGLDVVKVKVKVRKAPEAGLQEPRAAMLPRLRLSFIT